MSLNSVSVLSQRPPRPHAAIAALKWKTSNPGATIASERSFKAPYQSLLRAHVAIANVRSFGDESTANFRYAKLDTTTSFTGFASLAALNVFVNNISIKMYLQRP
eukprot:gnl/MRDRNA2_/MRDRNA2_352777_c0_seq1.p1 gnl/MRDRNA2_/MRDRNA2_352777_c0~~gnl/MRDRNA2_/MRDRNA2_352777_c0_seq1.p1  ORF type:complete len:105 (-),score=12.48 gnl/MRDRNA2_/MRDRNA2_352777_c0_seq1:12-326(-)